MGKLRKLRSRFISSVGAVKRSILRMQSTSYSTSELTTPRDDEEELQAGSSSRRNKGVSIWRKMEAPEDDTTRPGRQLKLHWSDGRRIYSEPTQAVDGLVSGEDRPGGCSSSGRYDTIERKTGGILGNETANATSLASGGSVLAAAVAACSLCSDDEEDNDDVFVDSWEDHQRERGMFEANCYDFMDEDFLLGDGGSFSGFSSGYSTISNDNLPSPALYLPPPAAEGASGGADAEQRDGGGVSGWDDWRIAESEVTLGTVINSTEQETTYSGYWHGHVQVRSRKVREVEDLTCFLEEVTTLSCIRHENIQLFMGACLNMQEGILAIVLSELKGVTLHTRLYHYGHAFTSPSMIKILSQIAEGMTYLHARGIPHGLLSTSSVSLHYRVCISLAPQYSRSKARQLQPCDIPYLPPECIRKLHVSQSRSHVVALLGSGTGGVSSDVPPTAGVRRRQCKGVGGGDGSGQGGGQRKLSIGHFVPAQTSATGRSERRACVFQLEGRPTLSADVFAFGTIIYELMALEQPYKSFPLETQIWRVGMGKVQELILLPRSQLRSLIARCWKEPPSHRPSFKEILNMLEQDSMTNWTVGSVRSLPCLSSSSSVSTHSPPDTPSIVRNINHF